MLEFRHTLNRLRPTAEDARRMAEAPDSIGPCAEGKGRIGERPWTQVARSVVTIALLGFVAKLMGFGEKLLLAYHGGTSASVDAYFTAANLAFFFYVLADDILVPVFLARYVALGERFDAATARLFLRRVLAGSMAVLAALAILIMTFPEGTLRIIAPGFHAENLSQAVALVRWVVPGGLFLGLAALTYATLNAHDRFAWPAASGAVYKVALALGLAALLPVLGIRGAAISLCGAAVLQFAFQVLGIRLWTSTKVAGGGNTRIPAGEWRAMFQLMAPLALGTLASQSHVFVDNAIGSMLSEGTISALTFARRLVELPILVLPAALGIVMFPKFARMASRNAVASMMSSIVSMIGFTIMIFVPLTLVLVVGAEPIVRLVFARGQFAEQSVATTGLLVRCFSLGLCAYASEILLMRAFYATLDTRTPVAVGLVMLSLNVAATLLLAPALGVVVIPIALAVQKTLKVAVLLLVLARRYPGSWQVGLGRRAVKVLACGAAFGIVFAVHGPLLRLWTRFGAPGVAAALCVSGLVAAGIYVLGLLRFGVLSLDDLRPLRAMIVFRGRRTRAASV